MLTSWDREQLLFSLRKMWQNTHLTQEKLLQICKRRKPEYNSRPPPKKWDSNELEVSQMLQGLMRDKMPVEQHFLKLKNAIQFKRNFEILT